VTTIWSIHLPSTPVSILQGLLAGGVDGVKGERGNSAFRNIERTETWPMRRGR